MSDSNRVFETLAGFRAAAHRLQRWLVVLGLLGAVGCAAGAAWGPLPAWTVAAAAGLVPLGALWGVIWRRRVERAFWRGARVPERGKTVRLPLEALALGLVIPLFSSRPALAADSQLILRLGGGRGLDLEALLEAAGVGGWIALALGALALLVALYLLFSLWSGHFAPWKLRDGLIDKISGGDVEGARELCKSSGSLLARSVLAGLPAPGRLPRPGEELPAARIEASGRRGAARWRVLVDFLAAAGLLAPVAGLLGTVLGMLEIFGAVAARDSSAAWVAAGAVGALVPAAVSLAVSLFALGVHYLAGLRLGSLVAKCEAACMECAAALTDLGVHLQARTEIAAAPAAPAAPKPEPPEREEEAKE